jgi:hypothetical protein
MPINLAAAQLVEPPTVPGINPAPEAIDLAAAKSVEPPVVHGIEPPYNVAVGFQLAKIVLGVVAAALLVLVLYLWSGDRQFTADLRLVYKEVVAQSAVSKEFPSSDSVEKQAKSFRDAATNPQLKLSADDETGARTLIATLTRLGSITDQNKAVLAACIPFPSIKANRTAALTKCADILDSAKKGATDATSLDRLKALTDFAKEVNDQRQSFHTSWLQEAQLILLNLLLPLLTGLFGYIFGTQQAPSAKNGS